MPPKKKQALVLPKDNIITDVSKQSWRIGKRIGVGGFGEVFLCDKNSGKTVNERTTPYVVKIEPNESGPLFVEMHFYMRNSCKSDIDSWIESKKLDYLGLPIMHSKGQYEVNGITFRFIVIDRFSGDLEDVIKANSGKMPKNIALTTGIRVLDVFEYIHHREYIHADIKASNIMLGFKDKSKVYVCDFGLAARFTRDGKHKEEKEDKKKMHNGTIEYTSRDAHRGMESRRADVEILAYNLLHWISGDLPWLKLLKDCKAVASAKEAAFKDVKQFVKKSFAGRESKTMTDFFVAVSKLKFDDEPNYEQLRTILRKGMEEENDDVPKGSTRARNLTQRKRKSDSEDIFSSDGLSSSENEEQTSSKAKTSKAPIKRNRTVTKSEKDNAKKKPIETSSTSSQENLTPAMREVLEQKKLKDEEKKKVSESKRRNAPRLKSLRTLGVHS